MRKIFSFILAVLMVCLCISGCSPLTGSSGSGSAVKITDDNQRIVTLKKVPERIVVLSPSFLELVEAVDGKVVGRAKTQVGKVPAFAKDAAEVGFIFNINVEKIVELKPDLVIAYKGMHERYLHTLESNNIPVVVLNLKSYEDVKHSMLTIGKIMRKDDKAQKVVANLDKDINATVSKLPKSERSVAILHTTSMGITLEKETSIAGGVNRFSFGVQAFDTHLRRSLGRLNTKEEVTAKLEEVAAKGVKVIIDLIYGLNGQTQTMLLDDIRTALACGVSGMDLYKLQIMPKSPLGQAIAKGNIKYEYNDRMLAEMFVAADALLAEQGAKALSCCHWAMREDERSGYNTLVKSGANIITCGAACGGHMGMYNYMKTMDRSDYVKKAMSGQYAVMGMGKHNENYLLLEKLSGQCDSGRLDFASLKQYSDADWESLLAPLLEQWELLDLLYAVDGKYYFTAKGKYYYRQMDRVLLTAVEYALYGKPGLMEQAGQKMMGIMKNMK